MITDKIKIYALCALAGVLVVALGVSMFRARFYESRAEKLGKDNEAMHIEVAANIASITELKNSITVQNWEIQKWRSAAEVAQKNADQAATTVLQKSREKIATDRKVAANPKAMNEWLTDLFLPSP